MKITPEMISEKFNSLPVDMQEAISSDQVSEHLETLALKYKLRVDKMGDMIDEVGLVMLGFKKSSAFIDSLVHRLDIDRETAESLAIDIDNDVFRKIRESLREVQFAKDNPDEVAAFEPDHGHSPARDSLLKEVERHGNDGTNVGDSGTTGFTSSSDYSADAFGQAQSQSIQEAPAVAYEEEPTPYEQTVISEEEKNDPNKTFKDHLEKKIQEAAPAASSDPYRESVL